MSLLDLITGGKSSEASDAEKQALAALQQVQAPTVQGLTLPELEQYAVSQNMSPAQMQAFLQSNNALATENVDQTGTAAQQAALAQLANTAQQGAAGNATEQAQEAQIQQDSARNLAGQRGAIDQQAQARGVAPGLLQAALAQQNAGQGAQAANQAALQAQSQNYQTALNALAAQGNLGQGLQGQQNTQANTIAQAQNAMQQFNAANQQAAAGTNAGYQQQANATNTANANQVGQANTGLANQRTQYNAQVPQTVFQDQLNKAGAVAGQGNQIANTATNQGQQNAGLFSGLLGAGATLAGPPAAGLAAKGMDTSSPYYQMNALQNAPPGATGYAHGGMIDGGCMADGGILPGNGPVPGDSPANDMIDITVSPGEAVIPKSQVQQNPMDVMRLLNGRPASVPTSNEPHPHDLAAIMQALKMLRGQ